MATLESLVARYRRAREDRSLGDSAAVELEVRYGRLDLDLFLALHAKLAEGAFGARPLGATRTVEALVPLTVARRPGAGFTPAAARHGQRRRVSFYGPDGTTRLRVAYDEKTPLQMPHRVSLTGGRAAGEGTSFRVALSVERPLRVAPHIDSQATVRLKSRASFELEVPGVHHRWRADLTVVRQMDGSTARRALGGTGRALLRALFLGADGEPLESARLPQQLRLSETPPGLYTYEAELEYLGPSVSPAQGVEEEAPRESAPQDGKAAAPPISAAAVTAAGTALLQLARPDLLHEAVFLDALRIAAQHLGVRDARNLRHLLPQPVSLSRAAYAELYPPLGFFLTDKADGVRALAVVREGRLVLLGRAPREFYVPGVGQAVLPDATAAAGRKAGQPAGSSEELRALSLVDGEFVDGGAEDGGPGATFYVFDVAVLRGRSLADRPFTERVERLEAAAALLCRFGLKAEAKPYVRLASSAPEDLARRFGSMARRERAYECDGLIVVEPDSPYRETRAYKWKPAEQLTVDFLARRAPASALGELRRLAYAESLPPQPPAKKRAARGAEKKQTEAARAAMGELSLRLEREGADMLLLFVGCEPGLQRALNLGFCPGYEELFPPGGRTAPYMPVPFQTSDAPLAYLWPVDRATAERCDGRIVELRCAPPCERLAPDAPSRPQWELVRVREDRDRDLKSGGYFGNDLRIAEVTWLGYVDPLPFSMLAEGPGGYFAGPSPEGQRAQRAFVSFVKTRQLERLFSSAAEKEKGPAGSGPSAKSWVVDLGAGRGQDLGRYLQAGVGNLVAVDRDPGALAELVRRKYTHALKQNSRRPFAAGKKPEAGRTRRSSARGPKEGPHGSEDAPVLRKEAGGGAGTAVHIVAADLAAEALEGAARVRRVPGFPSRGADAAVCNLALHYFSGSGESVEAFSEAVRQLVRPGGAFQFAALDGARVHARLKGVPTGGQWIVREPAGEGPPKYVIEKRYTSKNLTASGQKVAVALPFSNGELYEEYLVNFDAWAKILGRRGFDLEAVQPFEELFDEFTDRQPLTQGDREWLGLFSAARFRRRPAATRRAAAAGSGTKKAGAGLGSAGKPREAPPPSGRETG